MSLGMAGAQSPSAARRHRLGAARDMGVSPSHRAPADAKFIARRDADGASAWEH